MTIDEMCELLGLSYEFNYDEIADKLRSQESEISRLKAQVAAADNLIDVLHDLRQEIPYFDSLDKAFNRYRNAGGE